MTVPRLLTALAVAVVVAPLAALGEDPAPMQDGLWELSVQMEIPGLPFKPPASKATHCYTKQEVQEQGGVPQGEKDCKTTSVKRTGNTVRWAVTCTGKNAGTGEGEITFKGSDAYEGKMKMTSSGSTVTSVYKGKRLGDCK